MRVPSIEANADVTVVTVTQIHNRDYYQRDAYVDNIVFFWTMCHAIKSFLKVTLRDASWTKIVRSTTKIWCL